MNWKVITAVLLVAFATTSCKWLSKKGEPAGEVHNAQNSLDWIGTYKGVLPTASGEGAETTIQLRADMSYSYLTKYINKSDSVYRIDGLFSWNNEKPGVILLQSNTDGNKLYFVAEGALIHLDLDGNQIKGELAQNYRLNKQSIELEGQNWKLTELNGAAIKMSDAASEAPNMTFDSLEHRISGMAGCNRFTGGYKVEGQKLKFTNMATTMMVCPEMELERQFLDMLNVVDSYVVSGDSISLQDKENKAVAKFALYLK